MGVGAAMSYLGVKLAADVSRATAAANAVAQQAIINIRTVAAYNLEHQTQQMYESKLIRPVKAGVKQGLISGFAMGITSGVFAFVFAAAIWFGSIQVADGEYDGGEVIGILFAGVMAGFALGQSVPQMQYFTTGREAAAELFAVIDRSDNSSDSKSGSSSDGTPLNIIITTAAAKGIKQQRSQGQIEFNNVHFAYPSKPERAVLNGLTMTIPAGSHVALVGGSGSGKSTLTQLIERFYNPSVGCITLDGVDISRVDLKWLRSQIALVSQEPVMFAGSILNNVKFGNPNASIEHVLEAAAAANAMPFIEKLPEGLHTNLGGGDGSIQLSGGQKQRVAIARALLRNPAILLLLDEATSGLESENEALVQSALELLQEGRTTVVVAHRLATVVGCDKIVAVGQGRRIVEEGVHGELVEKERGYYASLFAASQCGGDF
jgi:ATP-binding cassette subfamily B (MDR/TAP) protein 1